METTEPLIFDGHNDVLFKLFNAGGVKAAESFVFGCDGAIDLPRAKMGGLGGGFFAIYIPSDDFSLDDLGAMKIPPYDLPLPKPIGLSAATAVTLQQAAILIRLQELGALEICTTAAQIKDCMAKGKLAAIMHIEGAEGIDEDFHALDVLHQAGLRSLGPVWSRPTAYGHGVPFRFPSDGDIGPGLTEAGFRLIRRCNELKIMVDLSHLNEAGFWDIAKHSDAPLVATHSNAHAICDSSRNLTDKQLSAIAESDGMVGVNFAVNFLREDGQQDAGTSVEIILRHLDHLINILGEDRVGLGSDYDGATVPEAISSVAGLLNLRDAMRAHGFNEPLLNKLCHENWLRVLEKTWGA
ncbi:MAG: dipeptidase [Rhizobiaceae bacterium]